MLKIHIISDLWLESNEWNNPDDENIPECDLVIINGNCGDTHRTMILVELLCKKYPEKQFIYNIGLIDAPFQKTKTQIPDGLRARQMYSDLWPKNLHYSYKKPMSLEIKGTVLDIFCLHGCPKVAENVQDNAVWRSTLWYRYYYHGVTHDQTLFKAPQAADVYHGHWPIWSTPELCREEHADELEKIKEWLNTPSDGYKVLVTAISPVNDPSLKGIEYTMYHDILPDYWFVGGTAINTKIGKSVIYGNPGSGELSRSAVLTMETG
jgi:hypothetical protein